ncbi:hypothetical protein QJS10_CPA09g01531 [Acorus calamus]|uniref:Uncharacterized protein n=1 Tax=Acorus calamus TaxID=4465 RepID=A0AAV9E796_ACOCL|nr:hypothetical protein QJS10_CPA09g01531 [Acorus calamus]
MGKNQAYKAMQRARVGSSSGGPEEISDGMEDELKKGELEADKDRMMREYRAQLDAERARKLALGRNHSHSTSDRKRAFKKKTLRFEFLGFIFRIFQ